MRAERRPHEPERVLMGDRRQVLASQWPGTGAAEHRPVAAGLPVAETPAGRPEVQPPAAGHRAERPGGADVGTAGDRRAGQGRAVAGCHHTVTGRPARVRSITRRRRSALSRTATASPPWCRPTSRVIAVYRPLTWPENSNGRELMLSYPG